MEVEEAFTGLESIGLQPSFKGKVREIVDLDSQLLIVVTDWISAFDSVLPTPIPGRGRVLNRISNFWMRGLKAFVPTHLLSDDPGDLPAPFSAHADRLGGRFSLVRKAERIPVECVVRGWMTGSGYAAYRKTGSICGVRLPEGLEEFDRLPEPIFTPTTKADQGHDRPLEFEEVVWMLGRDVAERLRNLSLDLYARGAEYAERRGIVIADTKFEFGWVGGELTLIDEALTPDSSRFWPADSVGRGRKPVSLDKQFLRDYLKQAGWTGEGEPPGLPAEIVERTRKRYLEAERLLTEGRTEPDW